MTRCAKFGGDRFMGICGFLNYYSFLYTYIYIPFFLCPAYRSDLWRNLNAQYTQTCGIMQG